MQNENQFLGITWTIKKIFVAQLILSLVLFAGAHLVYVKIVGRLYCGA